MVRMASDADKLRDDLRQLIEECRTQCLWFLAEDYLPKTRAQALRVLEQIRRRGNLAAFRKAGELKRWLLLNSNEPFAG